MAAAIARAFIRISTSEEFETLMLINILGLGGLLLLMLSARFDLDTSWAFF